MFKRKLPRRTPHQNLKPFEILLVIPPTVSPADLTRLNLIRDSLQEHFLEDHPVLNVPVDWNTIALLDTIVHQLNTKIKF